MNRVSIITFFTVIGIFLCGPARLSAQDREDHQVYLPALDNGDTNGDWELNIADAVELMDHIFLGGPAPVPLLCAPGPARVRNGDLNGDESIDLSDAVYLLSWLFIGGPAPVPACRADLAMGGSATKTPFTVRIVFDVPDPPAPDARVWVDGGGNLHVRRARRAATISGDFEGRFQGVANLDVDAASFIGTGFGSLDMDVTWQGRTGTWSGRYSAKFDGADFFSRFVAHGSGALSGTAIFGTAVNVDGGDDLIATGYVLTTD